YFYTNFSGRPVNGKNRCWHRFLQIVPNSVPFPAPPLPEGERSPALWRGRVRGFTRSDVQTSEPPHPNPLPSAEREPTEFEAPLCTDSNKNDSTRPNMLYSNLPAAWASIV